MNKNNTKPQTMQNTQNILRLSRMTKKEQRMPTQQTLKDKQYFLMYTIKTSLAIIVQALF